MKSLGAILICLGLMGPGVSFASSSAPKTFLAIEVQVQGDASPWRWWCSGTDDPLVIRAWRGFWKGLEDEGGLDVVHQLRGGATDVHPMYCKGPLDEAMARNLAGLFGASLLWSGQIELSNVVRYETPNLHTMVIRYREALSISENTNVQSDAKGESGKSKALWSKRTMVATQAKDIPEQLESAGFGLAKQVQSLKLQKAVSERRLRSQMFLVKDLVHRGGDQWLMKSMASRLPADVHIQAEGFVGKDALFRVSVPRSNGADLIDVLRDALEKAPAKDILAFDGTTLEGVPVFRANGAPLAPWVPKPEPEPIPHDDIGPSKETDMKQKSVDGSGQQEERTPGNE